MAFYSLSVIRYNIIIGIQTSYPLACKPRAQQMEKKGKKNAVLLEFVSPLQ
jgi:hypothetical protein